MDWSPPGSSVHGILQARILEWAAVPSSRGSSRPRDGTQVSCIAGGFITTEPAGKPLLRNKYIRLDSSILSADLRSSDKCRRLCDHQHNQDTDRLYHTGKCPEPSAPLRAASEKHLFLTWLHLHRMLPFSRVCAWISLSSTHSTSYFPNMSGGTCQHFLPSLSPKHHEACSPLLRIFPFSSSFLLPPHSVSKGITL